MNDSLLEKRIDKFEYVVSIDEDFDLVALRENLLEGPFFNDDRYASIEVTDVIVNKYKSGEWQAFTVLKYTLCPHCNQRDQIVDELVGIVAEGTEEALTLYLNQQI
jgi:hypothetical protein